MSRIEKGLIAMALMSLGILIIGNFLTLRIQQGTIETLLDKMEGKVEHEQMQQERIWNLHERVKALEQEDLRIHAHIQWYVRRRSGAAEADRMVAAMEAR